MHSQQYALTTFASVFLLSGTAWAQVSNSEERIKSIEEKALSQTRSMAEEAHGTLKRLASGEQYRLFGFSSAQEVVDSEVGRGIPIFDIGRDELLKYKPGSDIAEMLTICNRVVYPVLADGEVKSSIAIIRAENAWQVGEFGRPTSAAALNEAVKSVGGLAGHRAAFVAAVPSQNIYLKGRYSAAGIQLRAMAMSAQQAGAGSDRYLFAEGAPSGEDLLVNLAKRAKNQPSDGRNVR